MESRVQIIGFIIRNKCLIRAVFSVPLRKLLLHRFFWNLSGINRCERQSASYGETPNCDKDWVVWAQAEKCTWTNKFYGYLTKSTPRSVSKFWFSTSTSLSVEGAYKSIREFYMLLRQKD